MPITYRIDPARRLVEATMSGATSAEEILAYEQRLFADPAYRPEYDTLTDMRERTTIPSAADLQEIVNRKAARMETLIGTHRAIVASRDAPFGMMRMFEAMTGGDQSPFRVFRTMEEARNWLGLKER